MGPEIPAATRLSADTSHQCLQSDPLQSLPSPAHVSHPVNFARFLNDPSINVESPLWTPRPLMSEPTHDPSYDAKTGPFPPVPAEAILTDMDLIVGGALAPVHSAAFLPALSSPRAKDGPGLRLPSFESLGIAAPRPDRIGEWTLNGVLADATLTSKVESLHVSDIAERNQLSDSEQLQQRGGWAESQDAGKRVRAVQSPVSHSIETLTPPAETGQQQWPTFTTVSNARIDSPETDPGTATTLASGSSGSPDLAAESGLRFEGADSIPESMFWFNGAVQNILENLQSPSMVDNPLRVLSHALPSPSSTGHIYPNIISSMHNVTPTSPTVWINVFHAIPGRFNLADLPTSPPATPGPPIGGDDYFTQKVFDSAVPISDYQSDLSSLPRSPRPIVPPSSINVSIVERYIPPTSVNEFAEMFNTNGPSILVDRLVELSPHNGSLVFIYPTRTGAQTFMREYLGPLLEPIIRSVVVVHGLSSDLGRNLGNMVSIDSLPEHDDMHRKMLLLCAALSECNNSMQTFHGRRGQFELSYVDKQEIELSREVWARDWWTKQEKPRVKDVVTQVALEAQRKSTMHDHSERTVSPAELIQQMLDSVCKKPYPTGAEPKKGVEVSIFVIKRCG
ncbi:Hypothetical protein R9X50_00324100 [Acrodontium crateriforme]|uniref:Uncharacterized protein n=1 Tax=Acrodontium crateriforme TaxID=150365 RepID=A0AAQ3M316_9PEZI|nr:Hypothetical protein R9X50_00324100 [Acrodontium crateriforme]